MQEAVVIDTRDTTSGYGKREGGALGAGGGLLLVLATRRAS